MPDQKDHEYAELHCVTNFSFLRGASHPEELVIRADELGYAALAITDECSLAGVVRAHREVKSRKLKLIIGSEFRLKEGPKLVLLVQNEQGYSELCELITTARRQANKGAYVIQKSDFECGLEHCLCLLIPKEEMAFAEVLSEVEWVQRCFPGRSWLSIELLHYYTGTSFLQTLIEVSRNTGLPVVASGDVHMHVRSRKVLLDVLTAIRLNRPVARAGFALYPNAERHLRKRNELSHIYPPAFLEQTIEITKRCQFSLDSLRYQYPEELVPESQTATSWLRTLINQGIADRWPLGAPEKVRILVEHELQLIEELNYEAYFLTVYDLVKFARSRDILCQGRGSAANSAVCYCLGVTEVDPSRMEMLFERFISRERDEPPDIDIDFEHERREEVIQYIYRKYGRHRAALAATVVTYQARSAIQDVGKTLGFSTEQVNHIAKSLAWWDGRKMLPERFREVGVDPDGLMFQRLVILVGMLIGFPRHLSQHVGGFVITQKNLSQLVPIENAAMRDRTVIQWDKDDLENLGLLKVDVLALGILTVIHRTLDLIAQYRRKPLTISDIPAEDSRVYEMIQKADTVGVFQIESRAQMAMLPRLKPKTFYDLVIEVAIVRPGPIQGGMVHPYLRRRQGIDPVIYPSAEVKSVLERTLGVPIFQEQVMRLAVVAAGFTPGESDNLRRAMAAWKRKSGLASFENRLIQGMRERGYSNIFAKQIFEQIKGFGEYGFPESHSASFALLVYVSSWLKYHEPAAFTCALLNSQPMGFYAPSQLVQDAKRHGVEVRSISVRKSKWNCHLEFDTDKPAIRLGLRMIKGFGKHAGQRIMDARRNEAFNSVQSLSYHAQLNQREMRLLSDAGALTCFNGNRHSSKWAVLGIEKNLPLFACSEFPEKIPLLSTPTEGQNIAADYFSVGLTLGRHPLVLLRSRMNKIGLLTAVDLNELKHGDRARTAGLVINRQRPSTASGIVFITLEDETGFINVVLRPWIVEKQRTQIFGARLLEIDGVIERDKEVIHIVAACLEDHTKWLGSLQFQSRDFR